MISKNGYFDDCLRSLNIIGKNSQEDWADKPHETIQLDVQDTAQYALFLTRNAVICYFTDRCPQLAAFRAWAVYECNQWKWDILHVKFVGRNFFIIYFRYSEDRDQMLDSKPWYCERRYMYVAAWEPGFDVTTGNYAHLPVWVDIPFRVLVVEKDRLPIIKSLGEVLLYLKGKNHSSYPHDRACVLRAKRYRKALR